MVLRKAKLERVIVTCTGDPERDKNVDQAEGVGILGLRATIETSGWAYTTGLELRQDMLGIYREQ
jgi:hypothetical protein